MKWFEITTSDEARALRPHYLNADGTLIRPKIGDRVSPIARCAIVTAWPDYPEADLLTFEECMAIVRDEVTVGTTEIGEGAYIDTMPPHCATLRIEEGHNEVSFGISNVTTSKLRILVAILKGEKI